MPNHSIQLDAVFQALVDPTRRAVLERLGRGPASTTELAQPFAMALPSFSQHLQVLENSGLVRSQKSGRVRTYQLAPEAMAEAHDWLAAQRTEWETRLDQLDNLLIETKEQSR